MKKTNNIKSKIIAGLLSTVTAFSVGVIAISSASAAETYMLQQNDANAPVSFATVKAEDYGKQAGVNAANAAFDTLGQVFPGASILVSPFKTLFNANVNPVQCERQRRRSDHSGKQQARQNGSEA